MSKMELYNSKTYDFVICSVCGSEWPSYDAYETTRSHPMGEGKYLCSACASKLIRNRDKSK